MESLDKNFEVRYEDRPVQIEVVRTGKQVLYKAISADQQVALFLTRAKDAEGNYFWTSIPEGKQPLAEAIGLLIEQYIRSTT